MKQPKNNESISSPKNQMKNINIMDLEIQTLPREVLKWIQGLDLTYSVKNVKKDFNNGFLIAQILSRYHPSKKDKFKFNFIKSKGIIQMHSIDNGFSNERKRDNWIQIGKYLKEINEPGLKGENIEIYIRNENNDIFLFIIKLYQELTKRKIPIMEGKKYKTDQDDINRSYLLKDTGDIELLKKDAENTEKRTEEIQKTLSNNKYKDI